MTSDEALNLGKPQSEVAGYFKIRKIRSMRKTVRAYFLVICFLFLLVTILCSYNFIVFSLYREAQTELNEINNRIRTAEKEKLDLNSEINKLKKVNKEIVQTYTKIKHDNETIIKVINDIRRQNDELVRKNKELNDDNKALQNSLKMAASAGIKPQNYTRFNGITSRGEVERGSYLGKFWGTAYTPSESECGNNKGITNSGKPIIPGISLAVDTRYWPFGTVFYIRGLGYAVAMDTGSAIKGKNRFDFAVFDRKFANTLGARYWEVYLVTLGNGKVENIKF